MRHGFVQWFALPPLSVSAEVPLSSLALLFMTLSQLELLHLEFQLSLYAAERLFRARTTQFKELIIKQLV